ncbi:MAG TPA: penicillin acylase family protein, partial [Dongiaceae bacterium]|nr:penicillin acylase family protein [Dongiaceae bacterium]
MSPQMGRPKRRWWRRVGLAFAVLLLAAVGGATWLLLGSLPTANGEIALKSPGLSQRVTIGRDAAGIVTITAASDSDGYFALGFVHAQDRLFQMEMMRRLGAGRLSEIVGELGLRSDKVMRTLGLAQQAAAQYEAASPELRAALDSYAAGVNAFLEQSWRPLPPEFLILRFRPEPWRPTDSLLWGRIMAWQLSGNAGQEITNEALRGKVDPDLLQILMRTEGSLASLPGLGPTRSASNNWVIAGKFSASGAPMLANDPHLGFNVPAIWYLARIVTPDLTRVGATTPGLPLLVIGSNGHVAWGFTTTHSDTQDLYEEKLLPDDPTQYETPNGPQKLDIRKEVIKVKDAPDVTLDVRSTRHGPIISDLDPDRYLQRTFALSWTGFDANDRTPEAFLAMNRAQDAAAFQAALQDFNSPQQNVVYADIAGHIGFVAAGRVPVRRNIANESILPAPGWLTDYDWYGRLDFSVLPQVQDPPAGRIVTANNDIRPPRYRYFIGRSFDRSTRHDRIEQLLGQLRRTTIEDFERIQLDDASMPLRRFVKAHLPEVSASLPLDISSALSAWDGRMEAGAPEPLIVTAWLYATASRVLADELGPEAFDDWWFWQIDILEQLLSQDRWCDDTATQPRETCRDVVRISFQDALATLRGAYGPDWQAWSWGATHAVSFRHPIFSSIPFLGGRLTPVVPANGDQFTINRGGSLAKAGGAQ